MNPKKINVAVVGLGFMGMTHLRSYQQIDSARIAAVCDASRLPVNGALSGVDGNITTAEAIHLGNDVKICRTLDEILADPGVDLVDLCVPTPLHVQQPLAAFKAGKHVICEKPLARTSAQARELVAAAQAASVFFMPAMCIRFWPEWAWLKQAVEQKTFGAVLAARFRRVSEPPGWSRANYFKGEQSGGALFDMHIHDVDFVQYLFGRPQSVYANGLSRFSGAIDHVLALYKIDSGATVSAEASWLMHPGHGFNMAYTVNFERATADYDSSRGAEALKVYQEGQGMSAVKCPGPDGYVSELRHMIHSIQSGTPPSVTAQDALSAVEICEAEEQSIKTGRAVCL